MPIYHLSVKTVSRSAGRSATAAAAYRAGEKIEDEQTGEIHDYTRKGGVESTELVLPTNAPKWASERSQLWNQAEAAEKRKNATVAREFEIALPVELNSDQRKALAHAFAREIVARHGCAADVCIHQPGKEGDDRNHHAHILLTTRQLDANGFGAKTRELDDQKTGPLLVKQWRERFAELQNEHLERAGCSERIDHRSLKEQGIERLPTVHIGPEATAYERRTGEASRIRSDWEDKVLDADIDTWARGVGIGFQEDAIEEAREDLESALTEKAELEAQAEARRIERMSAAELSDEIKRMRPESLEVLIAREPRVQQAKEAFEDSQRTMSGLAQASNDVTQQEKNWRSTHPMRARIHDMGIHTSALNEIGERKAHIEAQQAEVGPRMRESEATWLNEKQLAFERIRGEQGPVLERIAELEAVRERKAQEEKARAKEQRELESQRQRELHRIEDPERRAYYARMSEAFQSQTMEKALQQFPELAGVYISVTKIAERLDKENPYRLNQEQVQFIKDEAHRRAITAIETGRIPVHRIEVTREVRYESQKTPKSRDLER